MYSVLVIDDDPIIRKTLGRMLAPEGYQAIFAANATDGLQACARNKPDIVLLDVHLPDGNGIEVCRKIKADPKLHHIPVLILTGEATGVDNKAEGLEAGADDYVIKPFEFEELTLRIKRILKQSSSSPQA